jgi:hypothetical protein
MWLTADSGMGSGSSNASKDSVAGLVTARTGAIALLSASVGFGCAYLYLRSSTRDHDRGRLMPLSDRPTVSSHPPATANSNELDPGVDDGSDSDNEPEVEAGSDRKQSVRHRHSAPRRLRKAETVLQRRTARLLLVIERATDAHNQLAVLRTAEALGVQHVHIIRPPLIKHKSADAKKDLQGMTQHISHTLHSLCKAALC